MTPHLLEHAETDFDAQHTFRRSSESCVELLGEILEKLGEGTATIGCVGVASSERSSIFALQMASAANQMSRSVLLVDAMPKNTRFLQGLRVDGRTGIVDVLSNKVEFREAVQRSKTSNIDVLAHGAKSFAPTELPITSLLRTAKNEYDVIVIHGPNGQSRGPGHSFLRFADVRLVVAQQNDRAVEFRRCRRNLSVAGARISGIVLSN